MTDRSTGKMWWICLPIWVCQLRISGYFTSPTPPPPLQLLLTKEPGQDSSASAVSQFFPPGKPQTINMPSFLNTLSILLTPLSSQQELLNAFAAFDEDDSGQIDVKELKDALLHTSPEAGERAMTEREIEKVLEGFTGRRAFGKGMGHGARGEVFRYPEFTASIMGSVDGDQKEQQDK